MQDTSVLYGEELGAYGFTPPHPFGKNRLAAFWRELHERKLDARVAIEGPESCDEDALRLFHTPDYVQFVKDRCRKGDGFLDGGDTPAQRGLYETSKLVVGSSLKALRLLMTGAHQRAFNPIGGLHHAARGATSGFCVFNDIGIVIEHLLQRHGIDRIAYVDIDAHHGDGVYYAFENDPRVCIADIHEDGRYLFPGTGYAHETGKGTALGSKLNLPLPPGAGDREFLQAFERAEVFVEAFRPEIVLFQCGVDSLAGDPLTHLQFSPSCHKFAAERLCRIADRSAAGRLLAFGGGGYDLKNIAQGWCGVVEAFVAAEARAEKVA